MILHAGHCATGVRTSKQGTQGHNPNRSYGPVEKPDNRQVNPATQWVTIETQGVVGFKTDSSSKPLLCKVPAERSVRWVLKDELRTN